MPRGARGANKLMSCGSDHPAGGFGGGGGGGIKAWKDKSHCLHSEERGLLNPAHHTQEGRALRGELDF